MGKDHFRRTQVGKLVNVTAALGKVVKLYTQRPFCVRYSPYKQLLRNQTLAASVR